MKRNRLLCLIAVVLCVSIVWCCFVIKANKKWPLAEAEYYQEGETAEFKSNYYDSIDENRNGYSAVLKSAKIVEMDMFLWLMWILFSGKGQFLPFTT